MKKMQREQLLELVDSAIETRTPAGLPGHFTFHPTRPYLYFLGRPAGGSGQQTLYFAELPKGPATDASVPDAKWEPLIDTLALSGGGEKKLSREEELLRERMRITSFGITSYSFDSASQQFLVPAAGSLFTIDASQHGQNESARQLLPQEIKTDERQSTRPRIDAKMNPNAPHLVSFVREGDLWVVDTRTMKEQRLTFSASPSSSEEESIVTAGVAEFVMQEEFDRYTGYWWYNNTKKENDLHCRLLYLEVDESQVSVYSIPEATDISGKPDRFRYPLAGEKNATSKVCIVELDASSDISEATPVRKTLRPNIQERYPWCEYVVRAGWVPPSSSTDEPTIWLQLLDRQQQRLALVTIPASEFVEGIEDITSMDEDKGGTKQLLEEITDIWINVTDIIHFFKDGSGRFIWASEVDTGFRHLYLVDPTKKEKKAITSGDWQVLTEPIDVDEERSLVFFRANKDDPTETHLYVASFASHHTSKIWRLTKEGHSHGPITVSPSFDAFVSVYSATFAPPVATVCLVQWDKEELLSSSELPEPKVVPWVHIPIDKSEKEPLFVAHPPNRFAFANSIGETSYGFYWPPANWEPAKKYPVLLYVYGGPHVQLVTNNYMWTIRHKRYQLLASLGYFVVMIDGVGSWNRGLKWEGQLKRQMGIPEIRDQILGLEHLMQENPSMDRSRVGVTGWSYGGYLSLMFLAQRPDFFKVAIAGGPVTLWEAYDTAYTERYMDTPQNNPEGYKQGSILERVARFPDEPNRLLLVHGLMDENVHFCNTARLIDELIKECKPYQLVILPAERHGVRSVKAQRYFEYMFLSFVLDHL
ncbi:Dipeptidyl peptidase 9 [Balamuthia mandrillaris]